ncbi:hypothetical protein JANAI62_28680 [Jannaschia pagri]|uniref:Uncharacterized protein n=1 Tax=Jannaschia pagri TaxID=2829797 RepID=A0ABQ4NPA6_9RHOB|nr:MULTISPECIES: hypothetical protein [unclassified Jannaschia]GIT92410.1 hypothetical protein JANAI61_28680 [Jannaschia sp. AI_61]GIT96245.1 hypothetical protein JANAI62_28680 [Jannaschia sp. AI_62]
MTTTIPVSNAWPDQPQVLAEADTSGALINTGGRRIRWITSAAGAPPPVAPRHADILLPNERIPVILVAGARIWLAFDASGPAETTIAATWHVAP